MNRIASIENVLKLALLAGSALAGFAGSVAPASEPESGRPRATRAPEVAAVRDLGVLSEPESVSARDGGQSALIGGKILWTFGDTLLLRKGVDGSNLRSNTAALADPAAPLRLREPLDAAGAPYQFLPFSEEEKEYNAATGKPDDRIALWVTSVLPDGRDAGLVYYLKLKIKPGLLNFHPIGTGLARVAAGRTTAERDPDLLFRHPEPSFGLGALVHDEMVYVYGDLHDGSRDLPFAVARVPLTEVADRSAYTFWDGNEWSSDIGQAKAVFRQIPGAVSVSYNGHLKAFLAVHSGVFLNKVFLRVADRPQGPWSEPVEIFTSRPTEGEDTWNYAALEHPELARDNGRIIAITYYHPLGPLSGEMRLVEVTFK